jgi:hypothetical protein
VAFYSRPFEDWVCHTMTHLRDHTDEQNGLQLKNANAAGQTALDRHFPEFRYQPASDTSEGLYDSLMQMRDLQRQLRGQASCIRNGDELPWEINRHGVMRWYLHPLFLYTGLRNFMAYLQCIPPRSRSGLQKHPGDKIFFFLRGNGHTAIDSVRHDWGVEDLLILPIRPNGATYQHFNDSDEPAFLFACEPSLAFIFDLDRGSSFEELDPAPEFGNEGARERFAAGAPVF